MENNVQMENIKRNVPRDVFLHLFNMVALYWFAVSFITLIWQYINYFFPDALDNSYSFYYSVRFALASLFVVFPLFIFTSWMLNNIYRQEGGARESKVRKWLIYLTLFITALVVVGDLIFTLNTFLNGEITARFTLKAFLIIAVALVIFAYYLDDIKKSLPSTLTKYYALAVSLVTVVAMVSAFWIAGSPFTARLAGFDQQRIYDLQGIQGQIVNYFQRKQVMPENLSLLADSISGYVAPTDPETNQPYEYTIKDASALVFELCATFKTKGNQYQQGVKSLPAYPDSSYSQNWNHGIGRVCFERKIDTSLYPPIPTNK